MHDPSRWLRRSLSTCSYLIIAISLWVLVLPAAASAHPASTVIALDDEARLTRGAVTPGVTARVIDGNRKLELNVATGRTITVVGYGGEPFLRFGIGGVSVNERSVTAIANGLTRHGAAPGLGPTMKPRWVLLTHSHRFAWHDHRLAPRPGARLRAGHVGNWSVPIDVNGSPARITGELWHANAPPVWPWLAVVGIGLVAAVMLARRRRTDTVRAVVYGSVALAGAAEVLSALGFTLTATHSSARWLNVGLTVLLAALAIAVFVARPPLRDGVAGVVSLLVVAEALSRATVFKYGYTLSVFSANVVRALVAVAIGGALVGVIVVFSGLFRDSDRDTHPATSASKVPPRLAVPKGKHR